jgi:hypothetical protein
MQIYNSLLLLLLNNLKGADRKAGIYRAVMVF